jgi:hypothetical protein
MKWLRIHAKAACILLGLTALLSSAAVYAAIDGTASIVFQVNDRRTVGLNKGVNISINPSPSITFADGSGANAANKIYQNTVSLSAGAASLDLSGSLTDAYGSTAVFARIKGIYIKNNGANSMVFGAGSTPWATLLNATGTLTIPAGGFVLIATPDATGWTVTAATGDLLNVTGTGTQTFDIAILGATS